MYTFRGKSPASASEGSSIRDDDKAKLARLRKKLEAEGRLDTPTKSADANASIDVLAEISAHGVPLTLGHTTRLKRTVVKAADPSKGVPILPSQAQVLGEMSRGNIGGTWYSVLTDAGEPHAAAVAAADGPSLVARGANRPLTARQQAQLAEQARASAGAFRSLVLGSAFCLIGAAVAAGYLWHRRRQPGAAELHAQLQHDQQVRHSELEFGTVGDAVRAVASTAEAGLADHEGLKELSAGMKANRSLRPRGAAAQ